MFLSLIYLIEETDCSKRNSNLTEQSNEMINRLFDCFPLKSKELSKRIISNPNALVHQINSDLIYIDHNSDFLSSGYNFPGNGTAVNPYLIEELNFTHSAGTTIYIQGNSAKKKKRK